MRACTAFLLCLSFAPAPAWAEQGLVTFTPLVAADGSVTVEVRNMSKLSVQVASANLRFAAIDGAERCGLPLPAAVTVGPAESKVVPLANARNIGRCMPAPPVGGSPRRFSVMTSREFAPSATASPRIAGGNLHPADLEYTLKIGDRSLTDSTTWHFVAQ